MTRSLHAASLGLAVSLLVPYAVSAQGLGDAAAQERERRKGKATKSYGDEDLGRTKAPAQSFETGSPDDPNAPAAAPADGAAKADPAAPKEKTDDEQRAVQLKDWRERMKKAQDELAEDNTEAGKLQTSLGDLSGNYYSASRTNMMTRLQDLQVKIAAATQTVANLQEEGRRNRFQ
jgi:hypothetical protein